MKRHSLKVGLSKVKFERQKSFAAVFAWRTVKASILTPRADKRVSVHGRMVAWSGCCERVRQWAARAGPRRSIMRLRIQLTRSGLLCADARRRSGGRRSGGEEHLGDRYMYRSVLPSATVDGYATFPQKSAGVSPDRRTHPTLTTLVDSRANLSGHAS